MPDQRAHDPAQARVRNVLPSLAHDLGEVLLGHEWHVAFSSANLNEAPARSSLRAATVKRGIEQRTDAGALDGTRIEIRLLGRELGGAIESGFGHTDVPEGERGAKAFHQIINPCAA